MGRAVATEAGEARPSVLDRVVALDYCVGCGVCAGVLPHVLEMGSDEFGRLLPHRVGQANLLDWQERSLKVCPFGDAGPNEDELGKRLYAGQAGIRHVSEIGYFLAAYAGYVTDDKERNESTSGGMTTWIARKLLEEGKVDAVAMVTPTFQSDPLFEFRLYRDPGEIRRAKKSRYYPVQLAGMIKEIRRSDGKFAVVALPCFHKALHYAAVAPPWSPPICSSHWFALP